MLAGMLAACAQETAPARITVTFRWPAPPEGILQAWLRIEQRADPHLPGPTLAGGGPAPLAPDGGLALPVDHVPNGEGRVAIVELRGGPDPSLPILYYGVSEPFTVAPGLELAVEVPVQLRSPRVAQPFAVELLFDDQPRQDVLPEEAQRATVRTRSTGAKGLLLANDPFFIAGLRSLLLPGDLECSPEAPEDPAAPGREVCSLAGWDLTLGLDPALSGCSHEVYVKFLDEYGYELGASFAAVGVCPCGSLCEHERCTFVACAGKQCGPDGCGGDCGSCPDGYYCSNEDDPVRFSGCHCQDAPIRLTFDPSPVDLGRGSDQVYGVEIELKQIYRDIPRLYREVHEFIDHDDGPWSVELNRWSTMDCAGDTLEVERLYVFGDGRQTPCDAVDTLPAASATVFIPPLPAGCLPDQPCACAPFTF